jgi:hypothetical protein
MEVVLSSETLVHIRTTRRYIPKMATFITTAVRTQNPKIISSNVNYMKLAQDGLRCPVVGSTESSGFLAVFMCIELIHP